jgi:hypothetical protein
MLQRHKELHSAADETGHQQRRHGWHHTSHGETKKLLSHCTTVELEKLRAMSSRQHRNAQAQ